MALPLPLPWGLALALGLLCWAWGEGRLPRYSRSGGVFSWGPWGGLGALGGGCPPPAAGAVLLLLLLLVSSARSCNLPKPLRCRSMPPALLPASHLPKPSNTESGQIGVRPHHPAQLGDPHEARPASAIASLHAHPAGVCSTRPHADNLRTET